MKRNNGELKGWLIYGSSVGGALCALLVHVSELMPSGGPISLGIPLGFSWSMVLGMIAGMIGGTVGSFITGALTGEDIFLNIGQSLGIGLINGFIAGTLVGALLGALHRWHPGHVTPTVLLYGIVGIAVVAVVVYGIVKKTVK